ncbi:MAG: peptide methionine sulfoxide reductase msrA/msrB [Crocinitomix sp.]|jgi:peptide methionine sulfoxide reductase msrA/msrB
MKTLIMTFAAALLLFSSCGQAQNQISTSNNQDQTSTNNVMFSSDMVQNIIEDSTAWNILTPEEANVIVYKGTEYPGTGLYVDNHEDGVYKCKRCNANLFTSDSKFESGTGWPSFDAFIGSSVELVKDADGRREEIVCNNCKGHLGHAFYGEGFTKENTRHCVNSISLNFATEAQIMSDNQIETDQTTEMEIAIFASGCFWGTEYFFEKEAGVISTQVGYIGGTKENPTYAEVCAHTTGHAEAVKVVYDPSKTDYETLCKLFFETHDPTQVNRQGPDVGDQYRTEVFYLNEDQKVIAEKLKATLEEKGLKVATNITKATKFWDGEDYHEHYYANKGGTPYCHGYTKRF